jgi:hypothetical protein
MVPRFHSLNFAAKATGSSGVGIEYGLLFATVSAEGA